MPFFRKEILLIAGFMILFTAPTIFGQNSIAQERAKVRRAARLDAIRQLTETIHGIYISSNTTVKDFVMQNDATHARFENLIKGAEEISEAVYRADGTCELTVAVTLQSLIDELQTIYHQYPHPQISPEQLEGLKAENQHIFYATGVGVSNHKGEPRPGGFWSRVTPQGRQMALRAARVDAYRNLAETIKGFYLSSDTKVADFVAESDTIRAAFDNFIHGMQPVGTPIYKPEGFVQICVAVNKAKIVEKLDYICRQHYKGPKWQPDGFQYMQCPSKTIQAVGTGVPAAKYIQTPVIPTPPEPAPQNYGEILASPAWSQRTIRIIGIGKAPPSCPPEQVELLANHNAKLEVYRQLAKEIMSLHLRGITVREFVSHHQVAKQKLNELFESLPVKQVLSLPDKSVSMEVELHLGRLWQIFAAIYDAGIQEDDE